METGLTDATVCVVGGTRGMGTETAKAFAAEGARVAVMAREQAGIEETPPILRECGAAQAVGMVVDINDTAAVQSAFALLHKSFSHLNALISVTGPPPAAYGESLKTSRTAIGPALSTRECSVRCERFGQPCR